MISFGSDNHAGAHPAVLEAIAAANSGFTPAYGADPWTEQLREVIRSEFGRDSVVFPVFNGSGANVFALSSGLRRFEAVVAASGAHVDSDETGAPERVGGFKLLTVPAVDQKLTPESAREWLARRGDPHSVQPRILSITQSTELGTVYSLDELRALGRFARDENLYLHVDGARIANAAVSLGAELREITTDVGVDVLSFGGTKNGLLGAEAVVGISKRFVEERGEELRYVHKQSLQLASKSRFLSAQLLALFDGGKGNELWRRNARHSNAMAKLLESEARKSSSVEILHPVEANAVFARIPRKAVSPLQAKFSFYTWDERESASGEVPGRVIVRWMTSFQTREIDVREFGKEIARI